MRLLCFGEIVWDEINGQRFIGGGPFNVAAHAKILGVDEVFLFSAVGSDALGETTRNVIRQAGVDGRFVKIANCETCVVKAALDEHGNARFHIPDPTSFDQIEVTDEDIARIQAMDFDCIYFGTIAQRRSVSKGSLRKLVEQCRFTNVFCDVNLRMNFYDRETLEWSFRQSNTVKLNEDEAREIRRLFEIDGGDRQSFCEWMRRDFGNRWILLTAGEDGASVSWPEGFAASPAAKVQVADTIGAGDSFAAATICRLYAEESPEKVCEFACRVGGLVASRRGAVPKYALSELPSRPG
jgi:fructokinase